MHIRTSDEIKIHTQCMLKEIIDQMLLFPLDFHNKESCFKHVASILQCPVNLINEVYYGIKKTSLAAHIYLNICSYYQVFKLKLPKKNNILRGND